jgi:hypothetical protein
MADFDEASIKDLLKSIRELIADQKGSTMRSSPARKLLEPSKPLANGDGDQGAISRAQQWVAVKMPYSGGVAGGHDFICGGKTVKRTDEQSNPIWDKYRTDCSGLISWAWGLPPPGATTAGFAPYGSSGHTITVDELQPGDALNSKPRKHIMLFAGWEGPETARVIQTTSCGSSAHEETVSLKKMDDNTLVSSGGMKFQPIRSGSSGSGSRKAFTEGVYQLMKMATVFEKLSRALNAPSATPTKVNKP